MNFEINNCGSQSVSEWINLYKEKPVIALEKLLFKGVYMGKINVLDNEDIISKLFQNVSSLLITELDKNILNLIKKHWGAFPKEKNGNLQKWSADWISVFRIVGRLRLTQSGDWLRDIIGEDIGEEKERRKTNKWFNRLNMGPARNPGGEIKEALRLYREPIPKD